MSTQNKNDLIEPSLEHKQKEPKPPIEPDKKPHPSEKVKEHSNDPDDWRPGELPFPSD